MPETPSIPTSRADWHAVRSVEECLDILCAVYDRSTQSLRDAFKAYIETSAPPDPKDVANGLFAYPKIRLTYLPEAAAPAFSRAFGKFDTPGVFETDIARPALFRDYLAEQLEILFDTYDFKMEVGLSDADIPYPYALESGSGVDVDQFPPSDLARVFPIPDLAQIDDKVPNGDREPVLTISNEGAAVDAGPKPLSLFSALRTDYSLQRLKHYTGTDPESFQQFILFTNYQRYIDEFVDIAISKLREDNAYSRLVAPGNIEITKNSEAPKEQVAEGPWRKHQMPAYHLVADHGMGVTLVNIGVGPSNAKTITDHLAVLRPQCWIMIGHCGGLRHSQRLGDYVLAHAYLRHDGVLDNDLPPEVPIPPIAEVQLALSAAASKITGDTGNKLKARLRTGTVVTDDDRNWELRFSEEAHRFNQSRAIAVDMESATLAANGYRFRVPYGTLLCVSDKPLHGEIKLPGAANRFYEKSISEHMKIGIQTMEDLRQDGADALHSRKLRSFNEPPFR
ncbi:MAG: AMP nucleosidase [Aquisalinus sp.]|nr:AMP nucleosidase [Aquisalinus sp.]